jgi:hypothetical protein
MGLPQLPPLGSRLVQADTVDVTANRGRTWRQVLFEGGTVVSVTPQLSEHGLDGVIEVLVSSGQGCSTNGRCRAVAGAKRCSYVKGKSVFPCLSD